MGVKIRLTLTAHKRKVNDTGDSESHFIQFT